MCDSVPSTIDSQEYRHVCELRRAGPVWRPAPGKRGAQLRAALIERPGCVVRRLARGDRAQQMQFTRFLHNDAVTVEEMANCAGERTADCVAGLDVLAIQDSSELVYGGKEARKRGFGPIGRGGGVGGLLLHTCLAVEAGSGALLGLVDLQVFNRTGGRPADRRERLTQEKESQRWIDGMMSAANVLNRAHRITVIADRESDIYEEFASRPDHVHLITRVAQNRRIEQDGKYLMLFDFADALPEQARFEVTVPAAPGRPERDTKLALSYAQVKICRPTHGKQNELAETVTLTLVDIKEVNPPQQIKPIHWRLFTTHQVTCPAQARIILEFYRRRWIVEDYFRTLKTAGFNIEDCEIEDPQAMRRFVAAVACTGVAVLQLVRARDGATDQRIRDVFEPEDKELIETLCTQLEGKTERQKNPHRKGTLAYAAWVIARLGSWDGYYGKPGPKVMRIGLQDFQLIKHGYKLGPRNV